MSDHARNFFVDLEHQIVAAATLDNRRRRRRTAKRVGASAAAVVGAAMLSLAVLPTGGATDGPLASVARAAESTVPTWARLDLWGYALNTTVDSSGGHSSGSYTLSTARGSGTRAVSDVQVSDRQPVAVSDAELAHTFNAIAADQVASQTQAIPNDAQASAVLPVPADALPRTADGFQELINAEHYGSNCGEKAMHLAADVLRAPGVAPEARRAMIDALATCPGLRVDAAAADPLGRPGTGIIVTGNGSGIETTTELIVDRQSGEPLSLIERTDARQAALATPAGAILNAAVFRYHN